LFRHYSIVLDRATKFTQIDQLHRAEAAKISERRGDVQPMVGSIAIIAYTTDLERLRPVGENGVRAD